MTRTQKKVNRFFDNLMSILLYGLIFLILVSLIDPTLSTRQYIGIGLLLGFFMGAINNLERVLRELFDKEYQREMEED